MPAGIQVEKRKYKHIPEFYVDPLVSLKFLNKIEFASGYIFLI